MRESVTATIDGVLLALVEREPWQKRDDPRDLWLPADLDWDGPITAAPISDWPEIIRKWNIAKQVDAGFTVWSVSDDRPKYWSKREAVFRSSDQAGYYSQKSHTVYTRNGSDPKSLYPIYRGDCAPDTPEMEAIKAEAMRLYEDAVEANQRLKAYIRAVPRLSQEQWEKLPVKPGAGE